MHEPYWDIAYAYGANCPAEWVAGGKAFEADITAVLQKWLQPLRELKTKEPIVNDFRCKQYDELTLEVREKVDLAIRDACERGNSRASVATRLSPLAILRVFTGEGRIRALLHELGHTFGLGDTYTGRGEREPSRNKGGLNRNKGGLNRNIGTQPAAVMSIHIERVGVDTLTEDDKKGIVWLYKVRYEGLAEDGCYFPDYKFEENPHGCVPKWPLIFEIKQGYELYANHILDEDPNIEINAQDGTGSTALFWATKLGLYGVTDRILKHPDVDVEIADNSGTTPLHLVMPDKEYRFVNQILDVIHDTAWTEVKTDAPTHHQSVFYLLPAKKKDRIFHAGYVGTVPGNRNLFVAHKAKSDAITDDLDKEIIWLDIKGLL